MAIPTIDAQAQTPAADAVCEQIAKGLTDALVARTNLYAQSETSDRNIAAMQNTLAGVELGKRFAKEEAEALARAEGEPKDPLIPTE